MKFELNSGEGSIESSQHYESELPEVYIHPLLIYYPNTGVVERQGEQFSTIPGTLRYGFNELFVRHPNRLFSGSEIIEKCEMSGVSENISRVWVSRLRRYLSPDPDEAKQILVTLRECGYLLRDESRPVELIPQEDGYTDFHIRVKNESADKFEEIMDQFGKMVVARRLEVGAEAVLFRQEEMKGVKQSEYPQLPEADQELPVLDFGGFQLDRNILSLVIGDNFVSVTPTEARLLYLLKMNQDRYVPYEKIKIYLSDVNDGNISETSYKNHLYNIRAKLRANIVDFVDPFDSRMGVGLRFKS